MSDLLLSAALIVRDEAKYLDDCLVSLGGLADEIVVVDTGSIDETKAIAARRGARLGDFVWCDDFSAARNHALGLARGRWILYIDADERVRCPDIAAFRTMLEDERYLASLVLFHVHPDATPYHEARLFRNDPCLRFEGVIHETIWPSVMRQFSAGKGQVGMSTLEIDHLGYIGDPELKVGRNLPLLERAVENDPTRLYLWCELGKAYDLVDRQSDAARAFERALGQVRTLRPPSPTHSVAYTDTLRWRIRRGMEYDELLDEALNAFPANKQLLWLFACRLMERGEFKIAIAVLNGVLQDSESGPLAIGYDRRIFGPFGWHALATCYFKIGMYDEAAGFFAQAVAADPGNEQLRAQAKMAERLARVSAGRT